MKAIGGVNVAAVTPYRKNHEADYASALELVDFLCAAGVAGIALLGSTGEFLHLKAEERTRLIYMAAKRSRVPIIAGVSDSNLDGAVRLAREACEGGAACLLVMPPYFFRYTQEDIREFYLKFAAEVGSAPVIYLYNIPMFTNPLDVETAAELLATGRFAGIKDSSGDPEYIGRLLKLRESRPFTVIVGNDIVFRQCRQAGADGVISGVACAVPELMTAMDRAIARGAAAEIGALEARLHEFIQWLDEFPTPVGVRVATAARGLKIGPLAIPLGPEKARRLAEFQDWFQAWLPQVRKQCDAIPQ